MVRTIEMGSHVLVQGEFVRKLSCGKIVIRVGSQLFKGLPIASTRAA